MKLIILGVTTYLFSIENNWLITVVRTLGKRPGGRGRSGRRSRRGVAGPAGGQDVAASMLPPEGLPLVSGRVSSDH